jgi:hypothetical protein
LSATSEKRRATMPSELDDLPTSPGERDASLREDRADHFAMVWGFA